ncbi:MAG: hypothetical protein IJW31_00120 [Lentisphaeria bacterium]|nr:hypothetical protein [Lentisphaeria bacterium]
MNFKTISVVALSLCCAVTPVFASASNCDDAKKDKCELKCKDNAVKHAKTAQNQYACPIAVWAAEAVDQNGDVVDEAVSIWQTADGNYWIAKQLKIAEPQEKNAVKTKDGQVMAPMTKDEARSDKSLTEVDAVKKAEVCTKGIDKCEAKEHTQSVDKKVTMHSKADMKKSAAQTPAAAQDAVADDEIFIVTAE